MFDKKMMDALRADAEKLAHLTGEETQLRQMQIYKDFFAAPASS